MHTNKVSPVNWLRGYEGGVHDRTTSDGGLTDNIGVTGCSLERAAATTAHSPLSAEEAVRLLRFVYLVVDAGVRTVGRWVKTIRGPKFPRLVDAITNAGIHSSVRDEFDASKLATDARHSQLTA